MRRFALWMIVLATCGQPVSVAAQCADPPAVAVFVLGGLIPGFEDLQVQTLAVRTVSAPTYPSEADIAAGIMTAFAGEVNPSLGVAATAGDLAAWTGLQSSSQALADRRDGAVLFAGSVVWAGEGHIYVPAASTHDWATAGQTAPAPASLDVFPNAEWEGLGGMASADLAALAAALLRTTDVAASFAACGDYTMTSWVYTPAVGAVDAGAARLIVTLAGHVGPPWNGQAVAAEATSWGGVRALYR